MASFQIDGRTVSEEAFKRYWTERFRQDPEMQRLLQQAKNPTALRASQTQALSAAKQSLLDDKAAGKRVGFQDAVKRVSSSQSMGERGKERAAKDRARELGFVPPDQDWSIDFDAQGFRPERANYWTRNKDWLGPVIVAGAGAGLGGLSAAGAFGGGAPAATTPGLASAAAPTAAGTSAAVPAAGASLGPGVGFSSAGTPFATGAGTSAGALTGGAGGAVGGASSLIGPTIGGKDFWLAAGLGLGGDLLKRFGDNKTSDKAAAQMTAANDKAMAALERIQGPYANPAGINALLEMQGLSTGAGGTLAQPMGTPQTSTGRTMPFGATPTGQAVPRQNLMTAAQPRQAMQVADPQQMAQAQTASSFVKLQAPDGTVEDVEASMVPHFLQRGARQVNA